MKEKRVLLALSCASVAGAIIVMLLPLGANLTFKTMEEVIKKQYSYFDFFMLWGYANFFPPMTAYFSLPWILLSFWKLFKDKELEKPRLLLVFGVLTTVFSLLSIFLINRPNVYAIIVFALMLVGITLQIRAYKK